MVRLGLGLRVGVGFLLIYFWFLMAFSFSKILTYLPLLTVIYFYTNKPEVDVVRRRLVSCEMLSIT